LMHLVQDFARRGVSADANGLLPVTLEYMMLALQHAIIRQDHADSKEIASKAADPGTLTFKVDFQSWTRGFRNYLNTIPGVTGIPLDYVIRDQAEPDLQEDVDYMVSLVLRAPLAGAVFRTDNTKVHGYLVSKLGTGPGAEWIANTLTTRNGRAAFQNLTAHFTGAGNVSRQLSEAVHMENTLHYKSEKGQKPWKQFLVDANKMFTIYEENNEPKVESYKVRWLCSKSTLKAPHLSDVEDVVRKDKARGDEWTYDNLCTYIGSRIDTYEKSLVGSRQISSVGSKHVSFQEDSSPNQDGSKDFEFYMKNFRDQAPQNVWNKFTKKQRYAIFEVRKKNNKGNESTKKSRKKKRKVSSTSTDPSDDSDTDSKLTETLQELSTTSSALTSSVASLSTIDNEDNSAGNQLGGKASAKKYKVSVVSTAGHCTVVAKVNAIPSPIPSVSFYGSVELDTHADTCVAGKNFIVLSFTGRECDVYPYSQQYEAVRNIPIVSAATAIQHPNSGETLILVFNEVLWYGDRMDHSLINPNQLRHFGVMSRQLTRVSLKCVIGLLTTLGQGKRFRPTCRNHADVRS
jgi:hypothetical protein